MKKKKMQPFILLAVAILFFGYVGYGVLTKGWNTDTHLPAVLIGVVLFTGSILSYQHHYRKIA